jgi:hypothetical protein
MVDVGENKMFEDLSFEQLNNRTREQLNIET